MPTMNSLLAPLVYENFTAEELDAVQKALEKAYQLGYNKGYHDGHADIHNAMSDDYK